MEEADAWDMVGAGSEHLSFIFLCLFDIRVVFSQVGNSFIIHGTAVVNLRQVLGPRGGEHLLFCFVLNQTNRIKQIPIDAW